MHYEHYRNDTTFLDTLKLTTMKECLKTRYELVYSYLETEPFLNITNGVITRAAVLSSGTANSIFIWTAAVDQAKI